MRFRSFLLWISGFALAACVTMTCTYPDFKFRSERRGSTSGDGGSGGTGVGAGGVAAAGGIGGGVGAGVATSSSSATGVTTSSTSSTSGGDAGMLPQVPCTQNGTMCQPGQICCYQIHGVPPYDD